ncbi:G2/mitotic-specific cyclin S13-7-like protein [Carex littledalei]|uniref:G2/mitotic-specific cyclin S13-7-like protein n=1 Tax=Carex littledalei TaxID=544730 RepID=A0A833VRL2_9POAL|nr:G2/mitotic-specific cyclin S13-7-like protein [Carex littledalei]
MATKNQGLISPQQRRVPGTKLKQQVVLPSENQIQQTNNKVAFGTSDMNYMEINEIDLPDINNQLAVVEYVKDCTLFTNNSSCHNKKSTPAGHNLFTFDYLKVNDLIHFTSYKYTKRVIICMEKIILNRLEWYLTVPTTYMFLVRFIKADKELEHMIYFYGELGLVEYKIIRYCPCMVAAAAVYAARCTLGFIAFGVSNHNGLVRIMLLIFFMKVLFCMLVYV